MKEVSSEPPGQMYMPFSHSRIAVADIAGRKGAAQRGRQ